MEKNQRHLSKLIIPAIEWIVVLFSIYHCTLRGFSDLPFTWMFNISADLVCMFIDLFMIMGIMFGTKIIGRKYTVFLMICHANFCSLFLDFESWMADGTVQIRAILVAINTGLYISNLLLTAAYAFFIIEMIVEDENKKKLYKKISTILLLITLITRLLNIKYGYFFVVDANCVYARGPYQYLSYVYTVFIEIMSMVLLFRSKATREQKTAVVAFTLVPFAAAVVSIFVYGLSLMYACVLVSIVMIYSAFFVELETDRNRIIEMFEKYVSNDVVQKIVDNPNGKLIAGRRYNASVLISDIRGFTALSEGMNPENLVTMLNHYFGAVTEVVAHYGGVVTEFLGDGIMCVFGAPNITDDFAERAVAAGLSIQEHIPEINRWNKEQGFPPIETGIGINTGTMVLGSLGNEKRAKYTAVGQTIDRAFEIESCSIGGQVLISSSTLRAIKTDINEDFLVNFVPDPTQLAKIQIHEVYHIGSPWNVGTRRTIENPRTLDERVQAEFCVIVGKHADAKITKTTISRISQDAAVIETDYPLSELDNIRLDINGKYSVFGKVQSVDEGKAMVLFTSKPEDFAVWVKAITE